MNLPMDLCKIQNARSPSFKNNIVNEENNMTEVDVVSGFKMGGEEPSITIENSSERPIISLDNDLDFVNDVSVFVPDEKPIKTVPNISKPKPSKPFGFGSSKEPYVPRPKPGITKLPERKREDSFGSSSVDSFVQPRKPDIPNVPFDFGDIADPVKHKQVEEVEPERYGGGYSSGGSEGGYSAQQSVHQPSFNEPSSYNNYDETEGDRYRREDEEKQELLIKLQSLESKGVRLTREFSMKSRLDDIRFEYEKQKLCIEREASVDFMKNMLITFVHGTEIMNNKWDPVGAKLDGWSESVMENIGSYESIFERLHEKYTGSVDVAPELELLMTLASSAFMFHMMQTLFKNAAPNLGTAVMQDPNLMAGLGQAAARAADMTNQQSNGIPTPSNQNMSGPSQGFDISSLLSGMGPLMGMMGGSGNIPKRSNPVQQPPISHAFQNPPPRPVNPRTAEPTMTGYGQQNFNSPGQQNFNSPKDDDTNSRLTDFSDDDLSVGSGVRISRNKSQKKTIHF